MALPKPDVGLYKNVFMFFGGHKHRLTTVLQKLPSCPLIEIPVKDIVMSSDVHEFTYTGDVSALDDHQPTVYKFDGKYLAIFGKNKIEEAFENKYQVTSVKLISTPALKQCREVSANAMVSETPLNPVMRSAAPPRSYPANNNNRPAYDNTNKKRYGS